MKMQAVGAERAAGEAAPVVDPDRAAHAGLRFGAGVDDGPGDGEVAS